MKDKIKEIQNLIFKGVCPTCFNKYTTEWCIDCQHIYGVSRKDIVENDLSMEEAKKIGQRLYK